MRNHRLFPFLAERKMFNEAYVMGIIQDYIDGLEMDMVRCTHGNDTFYLYSYSRWAANELLDRIIDEVSKPPPFVTGEFPRTHIEIIEEFIENMDYLSELCSHREQKCIFSTARYVGEEIMALFE